MNWVGKKKKLNLFFSIGLFCGMGFLEGNEIILILVLLIVNFIILFLNNIKFVINFFWVVREFLSD